MNTINVRAVERGLLFAPAGYLASEWGAYQAAVSRLKFTDSPARGNLARDAEQAARAVAALQAAGFEVHVDADARAQLERGVEALRGRVVDADDGLAEARARLAARGLTPRPYQEAGIRWLRGRAACLLADDMGLGKTMQVLLALPPAPRVLVVAPASVVGAWLAEAAKWRGDLAAAAITSAAAFRWPMEGELVAVSYDVLARAHKAAGGKFRVPPGLVVVCDEAHACKSHKSLRTKACRAACRGARKAGGRAWLLTGTPVQNRPSELRTLLEVADLFTETFGSWTRYVRAFGGAVAVALSEAQATPAVADALAPAVLRRLKSEVARDLPAKTVEVREVPLSGRAAEIAAELEALVLERAGDGSEDAIARALESSSEIGAVAAARKVLAMAKLPVALAEVEACEEAGEPLVVATAHRDVAEAIGTREGWGLIVGGVSQEERTRIVAEFQAGRLRGIALTIRAGGTGLTLTAASRILFIDQDWNPAQNAQAEDRIHRIGQHSPCTVVVLLGDCWIERRVADLCATKRMLADDSLAPLVGRAPDPVALPDLSAVLPIDAPAAPSHAPHAPSGGAAPAAPSGWLPLDDALRGRLERLEGRGDGLARWLLKTFASAPTPTIPPRVGQDGGPKRATLDLLAESEARLETAEVADAAARRPPRTPAERHAATALLHLASLDGDHARERNGVGFASSAQDGHRLARRVSEHGALRPEEWDRAAEIARLHRRQVGEPAHE